MRYPPPFAGSRRSGRRVRLPDQESRESPGRLAWLRQDDVQRGVQLVEASVERLVAGPPTVGGLVDHALHLGRPEVVRCEVRLQVRVGRRVEDDLPGLAALLPDDRALEEILAGYVA